MDISYMANKLSSYFWNKKGNNTAKGHIFPSEASIYDIGSEVKPFRAIFADDIVGTLTAPDGLVKVDSGDTPDFLVNKLASGNKIQITPTSGSYMELIVGLDDSSLLLRDGTNSLTGNLAVASNITIDGVDISAHAANPDAHHNRATGTASISVSSGQAISAILSVESGMEIKADGLAVHPRAISGLGVDSAGLFVKPTDTLSALEVTLDGIAVKLASPESGLGKAAGLTIVLPSSSGLQIDPSGLQIDLDSDSGLIKNVGGLSIKLAPISGLQKDDFLDGLQIDDSIAGAGIAIVDKVLHIDTGHGLELTGVTATDTVRVDEDASFFWDGTHQFNLDVQVNANIDFLGGSDRYITAEGDLIITPAGDLYLDPIGNILLPTSQTMRTQVFNDLVTGIDGFSLFPRTSNYRQLTIGAIKADEIFVRVFVADETRIDRGEEYWSKSFGVVEQDFELPVDEATVDVWFEESPAMGTAKIFSAGDWLLCRVIDWNTNLVVSKIWFYVEDGDGAGTNDYLQRADQDPLGPEPERPNRQQWRLRRKSDTSTTVYAGIKIKKGNVLLDVGTTGQGWVHLSALDQDDGPFIQIGNWTGSDPSLSNAFVNRVRIGNLRNAAGYSSNTYGFAAGNNLGESPSSGNFNGVTIDPTNGLRIFNAHLTEFSSGVKVVKLDSLNGLSFVADADEYLLPIKWITWSGTIDPVSTLYARMGVIAGSTPAFTLSSFPNPGGDSSNIGIFANGSAATAYINLGGSTSGNSSVTIQASTFLVTTTTASITGNLTVLGNNGVTLEGLQSGTTNGIPIRNNVGTQVGWLTNDAKLSLGWVSNAYTLSINEDGATSRFTILKDANEYIDIAVANSSGQYFSGTGNTDSIIRSLSELWFGTYQNYPIYFLTNNSIKATLTTDGKLGIGTSGPPQAFSINIATNPGMSIGYSSTPYAYFGVASAANGWCNGTVATDTALLGTNNLFVGTLGADSIYFITNNTVRASIDSTGIMELTNSGNAISRIETTSAGSALAAMTIASPGGYMQLVAYTPGNASTRAGIALGDAVELMSANAARVFIGSSNASAPVYIISNNNNVAQFNPTSISLNEGTTISADLAVTGLATFSGNFGGSWTNVSFAANWQNLDAVRTCQYRKIGDLVFLRGLCNRTSATAPIFTMPVGYRPTRELVLSVHCGGSNARIDINGASDTNPGRVEWVSGGNPDDPSGFVSLDGIVFSTV